MKLSLSPVKRHFAAAFFSAFIVLTLGTLQAQTPLARFVEPTNTTSTAVQPTFEIITKYNIDTSSVHWNLAMIDTPNVYQYPTICVMLDRDTSKGDTVWPFMALPGTGTIINDTTIQFQPVALGTSQPCEAVLMGLRVVNGSDTITISDTVARLKFITMPPPPSFVSLSAFDSNYLVRMHDTLTTRFSEKLDSANSPVGAIVTLSVPVFTLVGMDSVSETDSIVSSTAWLDTQDSTKLHIVPNNGFSLGQTYKAAIKLSGLTGDTTQDFSASFDCRSNYRLNIVAAPTGGLTCMPTIHFDPTINENYKIQYDSSFDSSTMTDVYDTAVILDSSDVGTLINAGDTVVYTAPAQVGGAIFKQWTGSGNPLIDTSTNPVLTVSETADQLHDLNVTALYQPVSIDTVCVSISDTNNYVQDLDYIRIWSDSLDCPLVGLNDTFSTRSNNGGNYPIERGKPIVLYAYSTTSGMTFDHWQSSDASIDGSESPVISFTTSGPKCVKAVFKNQPCPPPFTLCTYMVTDDGRDPLQVASILAPQMDHRRLIPLVLVPPVLKTVYRTLPPSRPTNVPAICVTVYFYTLPMIMDAVTRSMT